MKELGRGRPLVVRPIKNHYCVCPLLDTVEFLIKKGSDVNKVHEDMWSALMLACEKGNEDVVKFLVLSDGLDTTLTNVDRETAKDIAKINGFHDIAYLL